MSKQVFIVEDDEFLQEISATKLTKAGFVITTANDGEKALKILGASYVPDCVLMDLMMPSSVDGFGVIEYIRKNDALKKVPIIAFSNMSDDESIARAKKLGANEFMIKSNFTLDLKHFS